jgi:hypothetical protein
MVERPRSESEEESRCRALSHCRELTGQIGVRDAGVI